MKLPAIQVFRVALLLALGTSTGLSGNLQEVPTDSRIYGDVDLLKTSGLTITMLSTSLGRTHGKTAFRSNWPRAKWLSEQR